MAAEITVVIPSFGNYEGLRRVLDGYEGQDAPLDAFRVVVVIDHGDPDPERARAAIGRRPYAVRHLRGPKPGASANRNLGWRHADTKLVLFTDNDTVPRPSLVAEHLAWHRRHPEEEIAVLGLVRWSPKVKVTPFMRWLDRGIQFDYHSIEGIDAGWSRLYTSNVSLKRSFIVEVGGLDEDRFPYGYEDIDFGYRASKLGLRLLYDRNAVVDHERTMDLEFFKQRVRRAAFAEREFVRKHPELEPYFLNKFKRYSKQRPASGRGSRLLPWIPRPVPWLGEKAWASADRYYGQQLAPHFLSAWEEAGAASRSGEAVAPRVSELEALNSGGSEPGGPK